MQRIHSDDSAIESEIQAKGKTALRVTPSDVDANIIAVHYFTGAQGSLAACPQQPIHESLSLLTFCVIILRNGFAVTGESACASPENFDVVIGRKIAHKNAVDKIWALMGYALKETIHKSNGIGTAMPQYPG